jgi:hypothetical protein
MKRIFIQRNINPTHLLLPRVVCILNVSLKEVNSAVTQFFPLPPHSSSDFHYFSWGVYPIFSFDKIKSFPCYLGGSRGMKIKN